MIKKVLNESHVAVDLDGSNIHSATFSMFYHDGKLPKDLGNDYLKPLYERWLKEKGLLGEDGRLMPYGALKK